MYASASVNPHANQEGNRGVYTSASAPERIAVVLQLVTGMVTDGRVYRRIIILAVLGIVLGIIWRVPWPQLPELLELPPLMF